MASASDVIAVSAAAAVALILEGDSCLWEYVKPKRKHKTWVRTWLEDRENDERGNTAYKLQRQLQDCDITEFGKMLRMPPDAFQFILESILPKIQHNDTNYRNCISPEERLSVTLKFLATGESPDSLARQYRLGRCTISRIIKETTRAITGILTKAFLKTPSTIDEWKEVVNQFYHRWNYPACLGAVDGKHIRIARPWNSGSTFFNYKDYFSIVEMAIVNANYEFLYLDVGGEGKCADGGTWKSTEFYRAMLAGAIEFPPNVRLSGSEQAIKCHFVGDDAFALTERMMKPFALKMLTDRQAVFNYRLSRARRIVENVFGITASRFRCLTTIINMDPDGVAHIVMTIATLHNILRQVCGASYMPPGSFDSEDINYDVVDGDWRRINFGENITDLEPTQARNATFRAKDMRETIADHFMSPDGSVPWQMDYIHNNFKNLMRNIATA